MAASGCQPRAISLRLPEFRLKPLNFRNFYALFWETFFALSGMMLARSCQACLLAAKHPVFSNARLSLLPENTRALLCAQFQCVCTKFRLNPTSFGISPAEFLTSRFRGFPTVMLSGPLRSARCPHLLAKRRVWSGAQPKTSWGPAEFTVPHTSDESVKPACLDLPAPDVLPAALSPGVAP